MSKVGKIKINKIQNFSCISLSPPGMQLERRWSGWVQGCDLSRDVKLHLGVGEAGGQILHWGPGGR